MKTNHAVIRHPEFQLDCFSTAVFASLGAKTNYRVDFCSGNPYVSFGLLYAFPIISNYQ